MITWTNRARERARVARWMATAMAIAIVIATRVVGDKKGNGAGDEKGDGDANEEGDGDRGRQNGKWLWRRGWRAFDGGDNGDGAKDTAARTTTGESGCDGPWFVCVFWCVWRDHTK
jgi:hypothetical protein